MPWQWKDPENYIKTWECETASKRDEASEYGDNSYLVAGERLVDKLWPINEKHFVGENTIRVAYIIQWPSNDALVASYLVGFAEDWRYVWTIKVRDEVASYISLLGLWLGTDMNDHRTHNRTHRLMNEYMMDLMNNYL